MSAIADRLAGSSMRRRAIDRLAIARRLRRASSAPGFDQRHAAGGAGAPHRVEVHHRRPAAAGDRRAEHRVVVFRIVADQVDAHVAPGSAQLFGDDLRHRAGDVLTHVGLADIDGDEAVFADRIPDAGRVRRGRLRGARRAAPMPQTRPAALTPTRNARRESSGAPSSIFSCLLMPSSRRCRWRRANRWRRARSP